MIPAKMVDFWIDDITSNGKRWLLYAALLGSFLFFSYHLTHPIRYTAHALFNIGEENNNPSLFKALEKLGSPGAPK